MTISIIGAGNVGKALAKAFIRQGKSVYFGVPDPEKYRDLVQSLGANAQLGTVAQAVNANDLVIMAVPYAAAELVVKSVEEWKGKVLVDATNPVAQGRAGLAVGTTTSGAETVASFAKGARVVKAFNTTGAENMADSNFASGQPMMPICGDDDDARRRVIELATLIGFDAIDCGPLYAARYIEPFAMLWIHLAFKQGLGRQFAFARIKR